MVGRLLVIEDDVVHGAVIRVMAEKAGYETTIATSIARAVDWLRAGHFDCITLDLSLGELSGIQALQAFKALNRDTPIIIISGAEKDHCESAVALGHALKLNILPPVAKPVDLGHLRNMLIAVREQSERQPVSATLAG